MVLVLVSVVLDSACNTDTRNKAPQRHTPEQTNKTSILRITNATRKNPSVYARQES